ncbi:MAG: PqqD family protein [Candidatus Cloacimonadota bacterium]|nr:PqqD family protein [Candidatus Cloacimonadota bacterium]
MLRKNKSKQPLVPTVDEFLKYQPARADFKWEVKDDGLVEIKVPKFNSDFGKSFCKFIKKDNNFTANLDRLGSIVWQNCDGKKTVKQILSIAKKEFPDEKNIDQRLFLFLRQLQSLYYLIF